MGEEFAPRVNDLSWRLSSLNLGSSETLSRSGADRRAHECEPVVAVGVGAPGDAEEIFLQGPGGGGRLAPSHRGCVEPGEGGDFGGRARGKSLVHQLQALAPDV